MRRAFAVMPGFDFPSALSTMDLTPTLVSLRTKGNDIEIINQLLLPHQIEWLPIKTVEEAHDAIKTMKVDR